MMGVKVNDAIKHLLRAKFYTGFELDPCLNKISFIPISVRRSNSI